MISSLTQLLLRSTLLVAVLFIEGCLTIVLAQSPTPEIKESSPTFSNGRILLFPGADPYSPYIADPQRPTNAANFQLNTKSDITDSSGNRVWMAAGGRFGVLGIMPSKPGGRLWQISIEAGLDAQYDSGSNLDNIGYDGNYGFTVTTVSSENLGFLFAYRHVSGHVGDEWLQNNGRERIGYRRDELSFGATYRHGSPWRFYGEFGYGFYRLNEELQEPWIFQTGVEWQSPNSLSRGRFGWYAAVDLQLHQERDWQPDVSIESGLLVDSAGRRWRIGIRYVAGPPPITEFFQDDEQWLTFGLWVDL